MLSYNSYAEGKASWMLFTCVGCISALHFDAENHMYAISLSPVSYKLSEESVQRSASSQ